MAWTRPTLREICVGMEINGYLAASLDGKPGSINGDLIKVGG